ncbi:MAG: hypothetical protein ABIG39_05135 [Candidatus Micrarchaeota archaeon]
MTENAKINMKTIPKLSLSSLDVIPKKTKYAEIKPIELSPEIKKRLLPQKA